MVNIKLKRLVVITILALSCFSSVSYAGRVGYMTTRLPYAVNYTPKADIFRFDTSGDEYILLDYDEDGFFVTTKGLCGLHVFDPNSTGKFDLYDKNNMAYWLNNDFIYNGNIDEDSGVVYQLSEVVLRHIKEHDWLCEAGHERSDFPEDYIVRSKLALMSLTEYKKYAGKVGANDNLDVSLYYFLRTANGTVADSPIMVISPGGTANYGKAFNKYGVRPVFYLDREVFLAEKLNMMGTGDNVKGKLREVYSYEELSKTYSADELEKIYAKFPPQITEISISGAQRVGKTLKVNYKYFSPEGEEEGETVIRWLRSKSSKGPYSTIKGMNGQEYTITKEDAGYYIWCEVIPVTKMGTVGISKKNEVVGAVVKAMTAPYAEDVKIIGNSLVGERLIASYKYIDNNDSVEKGTVVKWQKSKDNTTFEDIEGETTANLRVPADCAGHYIRCIVTVHNEVEAGASVVSEAIGPIDYLPEQIKPEIEVGNGKVTLKTSLGEQNKIVWLTQTENGGMGVSQLGSEEYKLKGTETAIKAMIMYYSDSGIMSGVEVSDILAVDKAEDDRVINSSIKVSGKGNAEIISVGEQLAYSLEIVVSAKNVEITDVKSDEYSVYSYEKEGKIAYILTKNNISGSKMPKTILEFKTEGNGEVKIETAEAVYDGENGKMERHEPKLSLVGGNV